MNSEEAYSIRRQMEFLMALQQHNLSIMQNAQALALSDLSIPKKTRELFDSISQSKSIDDAFNVISSILSSPSEMNQLLPIINAAERYVSSEVAQGIMEATIKIDFVLERLHKELKEW